MVKKVIKVEIFKIAIDDFIMCTFWRSDAVKFVYKTHWEVVTHAISRNYRLGDTSLGCVE